MKKVLSLLVCVVMVMSLVISASAISTVKLKSIKFDKSKISLNLGGSYELKVTYTPSNTTQRLLKYTTSNKKIATVDVLGKISAVSPGTAVIKATSTLNGKLMAICNVSVALDIAKRVNLIHFARSAGLQPDAALVEAEMNKQLIPKINATIHVVHIDAGQYTNIMYTKVAAGEQMDSMFSSQWRDYPGMVARGAYADITNLIAKYGKDVIKVVPSYALEAAKIDGKLYGIPNSNTWATTTVIFCESEVYKKYNFPSSIKSINDLDPYMAALKKGGDVQYPLFGNTDSSGYKNTEYYVIGHGGYFWAGPMQAGTVYKDNYKIESIYSLPLFMEWSKWARKAYLNGWITKDGGVIQSEDYYAAFKAKKYAMDFGNFGFPLNDTTIDASRLPMKVNRIVMGETCLSTGMTIGQMCSVANRSKNKERAMMYLNLINTDKKLWQTLIYGIEGKHYIKTDETHYTRPEGVTDANVGYYTRNGFAYGNVFNNLILKGTDGNLTTADIIKFNLEAKPEPAMGFAYNASAIQVELGNVATVCQELGPVIGSGARDPETAIPEMIARLNQAGMQKLIADVQKQMDRWRVLNGK